MHVQLVRFLDRCRTCRVWMQWHRLGNTVLSPSTLTLRASKPIQTLFGDDPITITKQAPFFFCTRNWTGSGIKGYGGWHAQLLHYRHLLDCPLAHLYPHIAVPCVKRVQNGNYPESSCMVENQLNGKKSAMVSEPLYQWFIENYVWKGLDTRNHSHPHPYTYYLYIQTPRPWHLLPPQPQSP